MGFIFEGLVAVLLVWLMVWWLAFRKISWAENKKLDWLRKSEETRRLLETPGEPLTCVACRRDFSGPLRAGDGCPDCHSELFVVPVRAWTKAAGQLSAEAGAVLPRHDAQKRAQATATQPAASEPEQTQGNQHGIK